jgi:DNA-binding response OmpR family regulator
MNRDHSLAPPLSALVVDGYPDAADSLVRLLALAGIDARAAWTGESALAAAAATPPDAVIFEPRTPGGGWDLARQLGDMAVTGRPLLVALTTDTTPAGRVAADEAGASLYLVKPADPALLLDVLRQFDREGRRGRVQGRNPPPPFTARRPPVGPAPVLLGTG